MVEQLNVFLQNQPGKIAAVTAALAKSGVDIRALSIADTADFGILRMLVNDIAAAKAALAPMNCIINATDVTVVAVPDVPGGLARVLALVAEGGVNIEYMYSLIGRGEDKAYMAFRVSDEQTLVKLLEKNGLGIVTSQELGIQ